MTRLLTILVFALLLAAPRAVAAESFDERCRAAMAPYYAALLTSARGDSEGTLRHIVVLRARWSAVEGTSERPPWAGQPALLQAVASKIEAARVKSIARQSVGAHAELESIRALLRDARTRGGARTFDDAVTDYHEAMERLTGRAGLHNEISLNSDDYAAISEQVTRAAAAWTEIQMTGQVRADSSWRRLSVAVEKDLGTLRAAITSRDMNTTQTTAEELKARYFELLAVLARG